MTNEQREAIDRLKKRIKDDEDYKTTQVWLTDDVVATQVVLSLIKEQQEKLAKYEKIIDKISQNPFNELRVVGIRFCGGDIKQYFARLVEKE